MNAWIYLAIAIILEVTGTIFLKLSDGFEKWHWGIASIASYSACFWALAPAMKVLPVGVVYAIWSGVGIVAISLIGIFAFDDRLSALQYVFIAMILTGAVGLNLTVQNG
ncbi:multidrug efflux SMR transporter [Erythrobacter sp. YT30]|uniref:DMT family transporter n=1 Tax=Erythrobacter sp. YT30 TaxID=1735012 RepID=UPI00076C0878|nr:multidrug efflux SMR transporter [Erythrobacter sp. YT30]KWV92670.1 ligand-binding protein SH3 [Erythrobacter sp. YT30]